MKETLVVIRIKEEAGGGVTPVVLPTCLFHTADVVWLSSLFYLMSITKARTIAQ